MKKEMHFLKDCKMTVVVPSIFSIVEFIFPKLTHGRPLCIVYKNIMVIMFKDLIHMFIISWSYTDCDKW